MICRELTKAGWHMHEAAHGRRALALLGEETPDVILLDLMMPEMDGFEFVEAVQADPVWREIPIVVLTTRDLTEADRARLNGYVETIVAKGEEGLELVVNELRRILRRRGALAANGR